MMSKSDHIHEEKRSKIERSFCDCYSEWINHYDTRSDYVTDLDMFIKVQFLEDSPAVSPQRKIGQ